MMHIRIKAGSGRWSKHLDVDGERGATAVEYSILLAAIAAVVLTVVFTMGGQVLGLFESFHAGLGAAQGQ